MIAAQNWQQQFSHRQNGETDCANLFAADRLVILVWPCARQSSVRIQRRWIMNQIFTQNQSAVRWMDEAFVSPERTVLTEPQLHIPGVRMLARHTAHHALAPLPWHYHPHAFEVSLLLEGSLTFSTRERAYPFSGGQVYLSWPDEVHSSQGAPLIFGELYWFQLDISSSESFLFLEKQTAESLIRRLYALPHHIIRLPGKETGQLLKNAFSLAVTIRDPSATASCLVTFLHMLLLAARQEQPRLTRLTPDIETTLAYIRDHISHRLTLEELAAACGLSVSHYKKKFRAQMGISPRNYINREKIHASQKLLLEGLSVTETAMRMGFDTSSYFANVFRRYMAMTPTEYAAGTRAGSYPADSF